MDAAEREVSLRAAVGLFDDGNYLAAHELFEELWESTEGTDADFYKGLVQAAVALHHFTGGNLDGAAKLYGGHRRCLAGYLPDHAGIDLVRFLADMHACLRPVLERGPGELVPFDRERRPRIQRREGQPSEG